MGISINQRNVSWTTSTKSPSQDSQANVNDAPIVESLLQDFQRKILYFDHTLGAILWTPIIIRFNMRNFEATLATPKFIPWLEVVDKT